MPEMIAVRPLTFKGTLLKVGDRFTITEPSAKLLVAIKKAAYYKETDNVQVPSGKTQTVSSSTSGESKAAGSSNQGKLESGSGGVKGPLVGKTASMEVTDEIEGAKPSWLNPGQAGKQAPRKRPGK